MEKHKLKTKSKTPLKPFLHLGAEEVKDLQADLSKLGNSSVGLTERTMLTEFPEKRIILNESESIDDDSVPVLKFELEAKQNTIAKLLQFQKDLKQTNNTLKAQNNSLHRELNSCRAKNYELDVELYLAKEEICAKDKELEKIREELNSLQVIVKSSKSMKEENFKLKEDFQGLKAKFEMRTEKLAQKNQELLRLLDERSEKGWKDRKRHEKSEDFLRKPQSAERGFKLDSIRIARNCQASLSPEKMLNYTERAGKVSGGVLADLQMVLAVDHPHKILSSVVHLIESVKGLKKYKKFVNQLSDLVIECSPAGVFYSKPNLKQVWVWITRLLEEYMKVKKKSAE